MDGTNQSLANKSERKIRLNFIYMKYFILFFFILMTIFSNSQSTCIVIKRIGNDITIGADSRVVYVEKASNRSEADTTFGSMKKIYYNGEFGFGISGYMAKIGYDYVSIACDKYQTFEEILKASSDSFGYYLAKRLDGIRKNEPEGFNYFKEEGLAAILFFGYKDGKATIWNSTFTPSFNEITQEMSVRFVADTLKEDEYAIGYSRVLYELDLVNNPKTWEKGAVNGIISLIKFSKKHNPIVVGGDINFIEIHHKRYKQFKRKKLLN
jgi:hypothetical protein